MMFKIQKLCVEEDWYIILTHKSVNMCLGQVFAWLPEHLNYKILSNNEFKRRNGFKFQPVHCFLLVFHYYSKN